MVFFFFFNSSVFNPNAEELFQYDFNWKQKLYWLQSKRDIGLWIECCRKNCKKWRYVEEYHDPLSVPKIWYCEMNYGLYFFFFKFYIFYIYICININMCMISQINQWHLVTYQNILTHLP